jgi:AraC family transcriptional regulator, positive regulator of tynA and feaB
MSQSFSTDVIPLGDRLDAWLLNARQICGDCQFQFPKLSMFHGSIERRKVGGLELTLFSSSALSFNKFPPANVKPENRACIVITQLAGVRQYKQNGKVALLRKGDTTLIDSGLPWSSNCSGDCARLYLRIPFLLLERQFHGVRIPNAVRISGTCGLGTTLFHLMTSLYQQASHFNVLEGEAAVEAYLNILCACVGIARSERGRAEGGATSFSQILQYINQHLTKTTLCPLEIASAAGISVRHLHRMFSQRESTVNNWIRLQRLRHCWQELSDPSTRRRSITEIALYWGFNDSAHFSHSFKKQFGISPRSARLGQHAELLVGQGTAHPYLRQQAGSTSRLAGD